MPRRPIRALATDFDGTIAEGGRVHDSTWEALARFRASGRKVVLATGRILDELQAECPHLDRFDRVVVEDGAGVYRPVDGSYRRLADGPPPEFLEALAAGGVGPIRAGRSIVAAWEPHGPAIEALIRRMGLDLAVTANKRAVMIVPRGVDKASGLLAALGELGISPIEVVGVGDAENDLPLLRACGIGVAVANALPAVKSAARLVTEGERGEGVVELLDIIMDGTRPDL